MQRHDGYAMLGLILVILLIVLLLGAMPTWGYSRGWGWGPGGIVMVLLVIFLVLWLTGTINV